MMAKTKTTYRINIHPLMARDIVIEFSDPLEALRKLMDKKVIDKVYSFYRNEVGVWSTLAQIETSTWKYIIGNLMSKYEDKWDLTINTEKISGLFKGRVKEMVYPSRPLILWMEEN